MTPIFKFCIVYTAGLLVFFGACGPKNTQSSGKITPTIVASRMESSITKKKTRTSTRRNRRERCKHPSFATPLHEAAYYGDVDKVKQLIREGAEINFHGEYGITPLHYAAFKEHVEVVRLLLSAGADPQAEDERGLLPVDVTRNREIIQLLRQAKKMRMFLHLMPRTSNKP